MNNNRRGIQLWQKVVKAARDDRERRSAFLGCREPLMVYVKRDVHTKSESHIDRGIWTVFCSSLEPGDSFRGRLEVGAGGGLQREIPCSMSLPSSKKKCPLRNKKSQTMEIDHSSWWEWGNWGERLRVGRPIEKLLQVTQKETRGGSGWGRRKLIGDIGDVEVLTEAQCSPGGSCSDLQRQHLERNKQETISKTYNVLKENKCYKELWEPGRHDLWV